MSFFLPTAMGSNLINLHNLRIVFWNANGLQNHIHEFRKYLQDTQIDIVLLQETKLNHRFDYNISNYYLYKKDRNSPGRTARGVAVYIKKSINHYPIGNLNTNVLESVSVMVLLDNANIKILFSSVYVRNGKPFPTDDFKKIIDYTHNSIVAGDYNAHHTRWNGRYDNKFGKSLVQLTNRYKEIQFITLPHPTRFSIASPPSTIEGRLMAEWLKPLNIGRWPK